MTPSAPDRHSGLVPQPAWDPSTAWQGFAAPEELPRDRDPECGYLVTANNDLNIYNQGRIVKVVDSPYFTDENFFAIRAANNDEHGLIMVTRRGIRVKSEEGIDKDAIKYRATEMYLASFNDWRGYRHNAGA